MFEWLRSCEQMRLASEAREPLGVARHFRW